VEEVFWDANLVQDAIYTMLSDLEDACLDWPGRVSGNRRLAEEADAGLVEDRSEGNPIRHIAQEGSLESQITVV